MQVYVANIDFWGQNLTEEEMVLQDLQNIYPPRVTVTLRSSAPTPQVLTITLSNIRKEDNLDVEIELPFSMFLLYIKKIIIHIKLSSPLLSSPFLIHTMYTFSSPMYFLSLYTDDDTSV